MHKILKFESPTVSLVRYVLDLGCFGFRRFCELHYTEATSTEGPINTARTIVSSIASWC